MIEYVGLEEAEELDAFVEAHPRGHFMQTSLWGKVKRDWPWTGLILRDGGGRIRGTVALLRHDMRHIPGCFFYAPRGPVFSDGETFRELILAASAYARSEGAYLLRVDPEIPEDDASFGKLARGMGFLVDRASDFSLFQPRLCYVLDLEGKDEKSLEAGYRSSTRRNIHKALRGPLTVRLGGPDDLPAFCGMMERTGRKNGFAPRSASYFRDLLCGLGLHARLYLALYEGKPVAGAIAAFYGRTSSFLYGCSEEAGEKLRANELLQWRMQTDAIGTGCYRYDLRGVEGPADGENPHYGLHNYKKGFGAGLHAYIGQMDLPLRKTTYRLVTYLTGFRKALSRLHGR